MSPFSVVLSVTSSLEGSGGALSHAESGHEVAPRPDPPQAIAAMTAHSREQLRAGEENEAT